MIAFIVALLVAGLAIGAVAAIVVGAWWLILVIAFPLVLAWRAAVATLRNESSRRVRWLRLLVLALGAAAYALGFLLWFGGQKTGTAGQLLAIVVITAVVTAALYILGGIGKRTPTPPVPTALTPGWYPDPHGEAAHRWYNGTQWTDQTS